MKPQTVCGNLVDGEHAFVELGRWQRSFDIARAFVLVWYLSTACTACLHSTSSSSSRWAPRALVAAATHPSWRGQSVSPRTGRPVTMVCTTLSRHPEHSAAHSTSSYRSRQHVSPTLVPLPVRPSTGLLNLVSFFIQFYLGAGAFTKLRRRVAARRARCRVL